jgi:hypothetical protein
MCSPAQTKANLKWRVEHLEHFRRINNKHCALFQLKHKEELIEKRKKTYQYKKICQTFRNILID